MTHGPRPSQLIFFVLKLFFLLAEKFMNRKTLSADGLIELIGNSFAKIQDHRGNKITYSIRDSLLTAFAAFSLKYESFNLFFEDLDESKEKQNNVKNLYQIREVPSSTRLKEIIDPIASSNIYPVYGDIFRELQRGKALENFVFLDNYYLLALDGTQYFQSEKIHCKNCLIKKNKNGTESYSHQMLAGCIVHPAIKQVIPVAPEPIQNSDGDTKNDCERNAAKRFIKRFRSEHPKLPVIIIEDGLASNGPHIRELQNYNMRFIIGAKPGDHAYLFSWVNALDDIPIVKKIVKYQGTRIIRRTVQQIRYVNSVPLNDVNHDLKINFLELTEIIEKKIEKISHDQNGLATVTYEWKKEKRTNFSWVTDLNLDNDNVFTIAQGGRKRWAIENETFNTLKNQGYNFERNYGHGEENLGTNLALLMMLAFLVDQTQELCCRTFQKVLAKLKRRKSLWNKIRNSYEFFLINTNWHGLFNSLLNPSQRPIDTT